MLAKLLVVILPTFLLLQISSLSLGTKVLAQQPITQANDVTYEKQSNFIKEFKVPLKERSLKGITTDMNGNVWFYQATKNTSTIMKMTMPDLNFTKYDIKGNTEADVPVINLAGGQLLFDENRNLIWFSDARTNSVGQLNVKSGLMNLHQIPTNNSGVMGIVMSPDGNSIWFTEIIGNKIGTFDIESGKIIEYPTGDSSGPALLTFDSKGILWATLSYSNSILRVEPWMLIPESRVSGLSTLTFEKQENFSPFGIAIVRSNNGTEKLYISDHGSSRVIVADTDSDLKNYTSYWTSPSQALPMSLPSQVIGDKFGNVYFTQHGGNKISKISANTGIMSEYDIPTGPISASVFLALSQGAEKVWFTEWASNKIGYLDNTLNVPLSLQIENSNNNTFPIILKINELYPLHILLTRENTFSSPLLRLSEVELSVIGMTDSGLKGLTYTAKPQRVNMSESSSINGTIDLRVDAEEAIADNYTVMTRISTPEKDHLTFSFLYPQLVTLDVPLAKPQLGNISASQQFSSDNIESNDSIMLLRDIARAASIGVIITLVGYLIYRRINKDTKKGKKENTSP